MNNVEFKNKVLMGGENHIIFSIVLAICQSVLPILTQNGQSVLAISTQNGPTGRIWLTR